MDYGVLLSNYERTSMHGEGGTRTSQQQRLYACLRTAILSGQILSLIHISEPTRPY